jgi:hypothetical protein
MGSNVAFALRSIMKNSLPKDFKVLFMSYFNLFLCFSLTSLSSTKSFEFFFFSLIEEPLELTMSDMTLIVFLLLIPIPLICPSLSRYNCHSLSLSLSLDCLTGQNQPRCCKRACCHYANILSHHHSFRSLFRGTILSMTLIMMMHL